MRKVYIDLNCKIVIAIPEGLEIAEVVDCLFLESPRTDFEILDFTIEDHEVTDSK